MTDFDLSQLDSADESTMEVYANGQPTGWIWTFAGPGHPKTTEQGNRLMKERLRREAEQEAARVNGRKWKPTDESPEQALERNVRIVTDRLLGWTPIKMDGKDYPFTPQNALALLMDRRKGQLLIQALDFLGEEKSFTQRSANGSAPMQSDHSNSTGTKRAAQDETA